MIAILLKQLVEKNGSDLHLKVGNKPIIRVNGELERLDNEPPLSQEAMINFVKEKLGLEEIHISFDLDSMDAEKIFGVNTHVENGGFDKAEVLEIFQFLYENYKISSVDITELNPLTDNNGKAVEMVSDMIEYLNNVY